MPPEGQLLSLPKAPTGTTYVGRCPGGDLVSLAGEPAVLACLPRTARPPHRPVVARRTSW